MPTCFFVSDLHGRKHRYDQMFSAVIAERPMAVFLGGDLLPGLATLGDSQSDDFFDSVIVAGFRKLQTKLGDEYPRVFVILGNDDARTMEAPFQNGATEGLWEYLHGHKSALGSYTVYGYAYIPPTPFLLKDWERYDVSRYVPPGCVSPEEGRLSTQVPLRELRWSTIQSDLTELFGCDDLSRAILLFHGPPHATVLDRAGLDGQSVDHVPLDLHIGSIAVRRLIEERQPLLTLHGHVHESARLTGAWREQIGATWAIGAAHDGPELALVRFDPEQLGAATRQLL